MFTCHVCDSPLREKVAGYETLARVTSDCKPWPRGGKLALCDFCGCLQAVTDDAWREEARQIYREYSIWHQSGGREQSSFDISGAGRGRSWRILARLCSEFSLPPHGRLLDIGCGNGSLLQTASELLPDWKLAGTEFDAKYRSEIEAIPRVERLYTGSLEGIPGQFDLVTMSHVFEHWTNPRELLRTVEGMLAPRGKLLIQVPDYTGNPFELMVADHCTHFSPSSLAGLVEAGGFVPGVSADWIPREITIVAHPGDRKPFAGPVEAGLRAQIQETLSWLDRMRNQATASRKSGPFGVFGTSIAGTWLYSEVGDGVRFFVDEDVHRAGKTHLGIPIVLPQDVPTGASVFVALPDPLAKTIRKRLQPAAPPGVLYECMD